jgi:hypothetical protein
MVALRTTREERRDATRGETRAAGLRLATEEATTDMVTLPVTVNHTMSARAERVARSARSRGKILGFII